MPFPIVPAPSTATVLMESIATNQSSTLFEAWPVEKPKHACQPGQGQAGSPVIILVMDFLEASTASHAARVANFSSCDHGAPNGRPSCVTRRIMLGCVARSVFAA